MYFLPLLYNGDLPESPHEVLLFHDGGQLQQALGPPLVEVSQEDVDSED